MGYRKSGRFDAPCTHGDIIVTDDLARYERLKLYLLNLGHSFIAEQWLKSNRPKDEIVLEAMQDETIRNELEKVWREEVLPVLRQRGLVRKPKPISHRCETVFSIRS